MEMAEKGNCYRPEPVTFPYYAEFYSFPVSNLLSHMHT